MIKVRTKSSEREYILLGTGYGMFMAKGQKNNWAWNSTDEGSERLVSLCDRDGKIVWARDTDVYVVEVDGIPVADHFR